MTLQIKLLPSGDIDLSTGKIEWIDGIDAILQHIQSRLSFAVGNFEIYEEAGTPYFEYILGGKNKALASEILKQRILNTPNVNNILEFNYDFTSSTRTLSITFKISTVFGIGNGGLNFNL